MALSSPTYVLLGIALVATAYTDVRWRRIPNAMVVAVATAGFASQVYIHGWPGIGSGLLAAICVGAALWAAWRRGRVGGGDLKLAIAAATWVGASGLPVYLLSGAIAGGLLSCGYYLACAPEARLRIRANVSAAGLGASLPPIKETKGRVSVPYSLAIAAGLAIALVWEG